MSAVGIWRRASSSAPRAVTSSSADRLRSMSPGTGVAVVPSSTEAKDTPRSTHIVLIPAPPVSCLEP